MIKSTWYQSIHWNSYSEVSY